eukprot:6025252-Amphidinium_carterae.2
MDVSTSTDHEPIMSARNTCGNVEPCYARCAHWVAVRNKARGARHRSLPAQAFKSTLLIDSLDPGGLSAMVLQGIVKI